MEAVPKGSLTHTFLSVSKKIASSLGAGDGRLIRAGVCVIGCAFLGWSFLENIGGEIGAMVGLAASLFDVLNSKSNK